MKNLLSPKLIGLIGESFVAVHKEFDLSRFKTTASDGLSEKTLSQRGAHIADALAHELPADFSEAQPLLLASLGPETQEEDGLKSFFFWPHAVYISKYGVDHFALGMDANLALTLRFTAEFSIRPFIEKHQDRTIALLHSWAAHPNHHIRRLVSEGTRPRLPWASHLKTFIADPSPALPLLDVLKDDPELYVRRSVANHLGDILKDHPKLVYDLCKMWIKEISHMKGDTTGRRNNRRWMIRHAVRLPANKGNSTALQLRRLAANVAGE